MEPVPESGPLELAHLRTAQPIPTLQISEATPTSTPSHISKALLKIPSYSSPLKPSPIRRATDPTLSPLPWGSIKQDLPTRPRSPFARGHVRSQSHSAITPGAPGLARAKSMPGAISFSFSPQRPSSPAGTGSPSRQRALRKPVDEPMPGSSNLVIRGPKLCLNTSNLGEGNAGNIGGIGGTTGYNQDVGSSIPEEDEETPRTASFELPRSGSPSLYPGIYTSSHRPRRPSSPLRNYSLNPHAGRGGSGANSPTSPLYPTRYDGYNFPPAASSVSSTPNSLRSRSPSISSLETIPDIPDREAEEEKEMLERLRREAEKEAEDGSGSGSGSDSDGRQNEAGVMGARGRRAMVGGRDKSKRWSVCGAERRQDLDLETIWED